MGLHISGPHPNPLETNISGLHLYTLQRLTISGFFILFSEADNLWAFKLREEYTIFDRRLEVERNEAENKHRADEDFSGNGRKFDIWIKQEGASVFSIGGSWSLFGVLSYG